MSPINKEYLNSISKQSASNDTLSQFKKTSDIFDKAKDVVDNLYVDRLVVFKDHPFKIKEDDKFFDLKESISEQGVLTPLLVRVHPEQQGYYEILAGHHRFKAAEQLGITEVPCIIKNVDDNVAKLIVVESNKQRGFTDMLPSEIAKALKMEYDALKSQGKRTDLERELAEYFLTNDQMAEYVNYTEDKEYLTSCPVGKKLESDKSVGGNNEMSARTMHRYIRLVELISPLLDMVDEGKIAIRPAVDLSFLNAGEQQIVYDLIADEKYSVDMKKAEALKQAHNDDVLTADKALLIVSGVDFGEKEKKVTSVKLSYKKIKDFIDTSLPKDKVEEHIILALEFYKNNGMKEV